MPNSHMAVAAGKKHKKGAGKKTLRNMDIRPAKNGGFTVSHSHTNDDGPMYGDDETYAYDNAADMHGHVAKHFPAGKSK